MPNFWDPATRLIMWIQQNEGVVSMKYPCGSQIALHIEQSKVLCGMLATTRLLE